MPYSNRYPAWDGKCYLCRRAYYGQDHKCPKCGTTEPNYALTSIRTDEPQSEIIKGYHQKIIQKGVLGEPSKIREEFEEFMDSVAQDNPVMALIELSDLIGAIEAYSEKKQRDVRQSHHYEKCNETSIRNRTQKMTVYEMIAMLKRMPMTARVYRMDGQHKDSMTPISNIEYKKDATLVYNTDTVILS